MSGRAFITGKAMVCSLGDSVKEIVDAVRKKRIKLEQLPFTLAGLPYTRPYYLIMRNEANLFATGGAIAYNCRQVVWLVVRVQVIGRL